MKTSDQIHLEEAYVNVASKKRSYEEKSKEAEQIFKDIFQAFNDLSENSLEFSYVVGPEKQPGHISSGNYIITKNKDNTLHWGYVWQGQTYGRNITPHSVDQINDNKKLLEFLKTKLLTKTSVD